MRRAAALALLFACAFATAARASEQSEALAARGLIALDAGDTQGALSYFDRAVAADPNDATARYQRGVARGRLGDSAGAIADFEAALALRPDFPNAALELGIALVDAGRFADADPWLVRARVDPALDAQASFFLGIAQLRLERYEDAKRSFARARTRDPSLALATQYYEGVIAYRERDFDGARDAFEAVASASPTSAMGREATEYLALIRGARRASYSAFGSVALEYDSNVVLNPDGTSVPGAVTNASDGRFVITLGGRYVPLRRGRLSLAMSYDFFQTLQFQLDDFNLQDHRPGLHLQYDADRVSLGLSSHYDYYLLGGASYLQQASGFPWVSVREPGFGRTDLFYRMQWRGYYGDFDPLNGCYHTFGVRQFVDVGSAEQQVWFGYQFEDTDITGTKNFGTAAQPIRLNAFEYRAHVGEVGLRWPLVFGFTGQAGCRIEYQDYDSDSRVYAAQGVEYVLPLQGERRKDYDYRGIVSVERPLPELYEDLIFVASWFGTWNNSNKAVFEYERQIASIGLQVRF